jgi:twinkle protein
MAGIQIDMLPHSCGTKKGLKVFAQEDGRVDGYCFACHTPVKDPYGDNRTVKDIPKRTVKTEEEIQSEIAEISSYQIIDVPSRKLRESTLGKFNARVSVSEKDGKTPTAIYWPVTKDGKLVGYHAKVLDKSCHPYNIGETRDCDLLNWPVAKSSGAYRLIITEGPEDMASVDRIYEMYGGNEDYHPAVASLPHGSASAKRVLTKHAEDIRRLFKEVILCFDDDDAGNLAVEKAMQVLPAAKSVKLPTKDANQALMEGKAKAAYNALAYHAEVPKNTRLVFGADIHDKAREPAKFGELSWPFPKMNDALRGVRLSETIYIGAGVKMGKSELRNTLAAHFMREHNAKVFMAAPEEANAKSYKMIAGKLESKIFHDPKVEFDYEAYDRAGKFLKDQLVMLNLYQHIGWESLKKDMVAAAEWGAKAHFIDPITNLTNGVNSADANTMLQGIAQDISSMALDLGIVVFMFCHLKSPEGNISADQRMTKYKQGKYIGLGNCPHELGGDVLSSQFAGSRAMMRSANLMIGLEGNKDPELPDEIRNTRLIRILEDREFGVSEKFPLFWNRNTGQYAEL